MTSLMEEQETLQQEMKLKHKQDLEADTLAQPQTFRASCSNHTEAYAI